MSILNRMFENLWDKHEALMSLHDGYVPRAEKQKSSWILAKIENAVPFLKQRRLMYGQNAYRQQLNMAMQQSNTIFTNNIFSNNVVGNSSSTNAYGYYHPHGLSGTLQAIPAGPPVGHYVVPHLWTSSIRTSREVIYMALHGIEEASMVRPAGNLPYDEPALHALDTREEKPKLLNLASFCLCNKYPVADLLLLLEGNGITVED